MIPKNSNEAAEIITGGLESIAEALQAIAYALDNVATSINDLKETDDNGGES